MAEKRPWCGCAFLHTAVRDELEEHGRLCAGFPVVSAGRSLLVSWLDIMRGSGINTHASLPLSLATLLYNAGLRPYCQHFSVSIRKKRTVTGKIIQ